MDDENLYKREEDRDWRARTDDRLASLTTGETVQNDRLDDLEENFLALDKVIRGDTDKDTSGVIGRLHDQETAIARLNAILNMDSVGNPGIAKKVEVLWKKELREDNRLERHWKFYGLLAGAILLLAREIIHDLPEIEAFWDKHYTAEQAPKAKRIKTKRRKTREIEDTDLPTAE